MKVVIELNYVLIILDWILIFGGFYLIIFNTSVLGSVLGVLCVMISLIIPEKMEGSISQSLHPTRYELWFLAIWLIAFVGLNVIWSDGYLATPYFNMAIFLYFAYRLYRSYKNEQ